MLNVNVICVGKLKETYWREACAEYAKRLGAFCRLNIIELGESRLPQDPNGSQIAAALASEGKSFRQYLSQKGTFSAALCVEAPQLSSEEFAKKIENAAVGGASTINFLIGSSFGLDQEVKSLCDIKVGMSKMTFPHQLARVILLEQLYRAFSIIAGGKYHK